MDAGFFPGVYQVAPPVNSSAPGKVGTYSFDATYLYVCVGANQWKRITLEGY